jgi:glycosyltransferase involved in cell wall biosynthesis
MSKKIAIVMTYYQRQYQLTKTLLSIAKSNHKDFEIIIVDDGSPDDIVLPELPYKATVIKITDKKWTNPEPAYNTGIIRVLENNPDIIILQNAENYHVGDILTESLSVTPETYISFGCYSIDEQTTFSDHNIFEIVFKNNTGAVVDGANSWYNHPVHRPVSYDFCSAITAGNLRKLNGYDERFSDGWAYGDDYLLHRIRKMGLLIEVTENPFVVHQWHYNRSRPEDWGDRVARNSKLFSELSQTDDIRAEHIYTSDL